MAHVEEGLTDGTSFLSIVEEASKFGFCGAGHNVAQDVADDVNGAVQRRTRGVGCRLLVAEVENAAHAGPCFWFRQV
jgi:hypothetical protein